MVTKVKVREAEGGDNTMDRGRAEGDSARKDSVVEGNELEVTGSDTVAQVLQPTILAHRYTQELSTVNYRNSMLDR